MRSILVIASLAAAVMLVGCGKGPEGPQGQQGVPGPQGAQALSQHATVAIQVVLRSWANPGGSEDSLTSLDPSAVVRDCCCLRGRHEMVDRARRGAQRLGSRSQDCL